ncbi:hypothetical protein CA85_05840 [Allorhodopirellula solitaria]|uniref:Uncharacterized protein n=1 Tax=Allorhodopirellula solitaria TaxID=2527987 RepID=A0A5C5YKA2_9BACT|nr:hypothetical protein CA85_05840 [Allorhodopirellula solitaria]
MLAFLPILPMTLPPQPDSSLGQFGLEFLRAAPMREELAHPSEACAGTQRRAFGEFLLYSPMAF